MSIKIKIFESNLKSKGNNTAYYPKFQSYNTYSTQQFAEMLSINQSISLSNVKAVLDAMGAQLLDCLSNGHNVKIDGVGTFSLNVSGKVTFKDSKVSPKHLYVDGIGLLPDTKASKQMKHIKIQLIGNMPQPKRTIDISSAEELVNEMLGENSALFVSDFARRANVSDYTSRKVLNQLVVNGLLVRSGARGHYVYSKPKEAV